MKYKVILYNQGSAGEVDNAGNFTFYTSSQAEAMCDAWIELNLNNRAWLWNGLTWRLFG